MSFLAWHDEQSTGPTCGVCGEPLRLDLGPASAHRCPIGKREDAPPAGWLGAFIFALAVVFVGLVVYAASIAHNAEVVR